MLWTILVGAIATSGGSAIHNATANTASAIQIPGVALDDGAGATWFSYGIRDFHCCGCFVISANHGDDAARVFGNTGANSGVAVRIDGDTAADAIAGIEFVWRVNDETRITKIGASDMAAMSGAAEGVPVIWWFSWDDGADTMTYGVRMPHAEGVVWEEHTETDTATPTVPLTPNALSDVAGANLAGGILCGWVRAGQLVSADLDNVFGATPPHDGDLDDIWGRIRNDDNFAGSTGDVKVAWPCGSFDEATRVGDEVTGADFAYQSEAIGSVWRTKTTDDSLAIVTGSDWKYGDPFDGDGPFARKTHDWHANANGYIAGACDAYYEMVHGTYSTRRRVMDGANSRGMRHSSDAFGMQNWANARFVLNKSDAIGYGFAPRCGNARGGNSPFPYFAGGLEAAGPGVIGTNTASDTQDASASWGRFTTGANGNGTSGQGIFMAAGSSWWCGVRPEAGSRFDDESQPVTIRAIFLETPGFGVVSAQKQERTTAGSTGTDVGAATATDLDPGGAVTATVSSAGSDTVALDSVAGMSEGDTIWVSSFETTGDFACGVIDDITNLTVRSEFDWGHYTPVAGDTVTSGASASYVVIEVMFTGPPSVSGDYRGVEFTMSDGPGFLMHVEAFRNDANGLVCIEQGMSGASYTTQIARMFSTHQWMQAIDPDVFIAHFANQGDTTGAFWDAIANEAAAKNPDMPIIFAPDMEHGSSQDEQPTWHDTAFTKAANHTNVVAVIDPIEDPFTFVGSIEDQWYPSSHRADQGAAYEGPLRRNGDQAHPAASSLQYWLSREQALGVEAISLEVDPCPADVNTDGIVDTADLLILLDAWGTCDACEADLNANGAVDTSDVLILFGGWGLCP